MSFKLKLFFFVIVPFLIGYLIHTFFLSETLVEDVPETWWGEGAPKDSLYPSLPQKFRIDIPQKDVDDLKNRLNQPLRLTKPLDNVNFTYGFNTNALKNIHDFWLKKYDWRTREKLLNAYDHYRMQVQGLSIHYIHVKAKVTPGAKVVPLLLLHGWPGSFREFTDFIPILVDKTKKHGLHLDIVVPSLPGYGFSQASSKPGLGSIQTSVIMKNLMLQLGYQKFYVQGGDWGGLIGDHMATLYPQHILGLHSNICNVAFSPVVQLHLLFGSLWPSLVVDKAHEHLVYPVSKHFFKLVEETGYLHIQATKPDTVGVALNESPLGLAAYILEKYSTWTNPSFRNLPDGGLTRRFTMEQLLDQVSIYWLTNSITTSMRMYSGSFTKEHMSSSVFKAKTNVPTACLRMAHELAYTPDSLLTYKFGNLIQTTDHDDGGHFPSMEHPNFMAEDLTQALVKMQALNTAQ